MHIDDIDSKQQSGSPNEDTLPRKPLSDHKPKQAPDEEEPALLGTPPDIFNVESDKEAEPIQPLKDEEDFLSAEPPGDSNTLI